MVGLRDGWYCHVRNVHDKMADGEPVYGSPKISCKPISSQDEARLHHFGKKMLSGIPIRNVICPGKGWSGDLPTASDVENLPASDIHVKQPHVLQQRKVRLRECRQGQLLLPRQCSAQCLSHIQHQTHIVRE